MKLSQFKFKLPEDRIAQYPVEHRDESRLMVVHKKSDEIEHVLFKDILNYFDEKDVFVFNDTRVFPARMYGNKEKNHEDVIMEVDGNITLEHAEILSKIGASIFVAGTSCLFTGDIKDYAQNLEKLRKAINK